MLRRRLLVALGIAGLLLVAFFAYRTYVLGYSNEELAAHYYETAVLPAAPDSSRYGEGLRWLAEDGFQQATAAFNQIARTHPDYPSAQYYAGHAYYRNQQWNAAMTALQNVTGLGPSTVREDAEWLLLITYLRAGRTERNFFTLLARVLEQYAHKHGVKARALADDLSSPWRSRWEALTQGRGGY